MSSFRTALAIRSKKEISSLQTTQAIHLGKIVFRSNTLGYPLDKEMSFLRMTQANPFEKNCHPFERLGLSVQNNCQPRYYCKSLSPDPFAIEPVKTSCSLNNSSKRRLSSSYEFSRAIFD